MGDPKPAALFVVPARQCLGQRMGVADSAYAVFQAVVQEEN
jgi:hypothetical protein